MLTGASGSRHTRAESQNATAAGSPPTTDGALRPWAEPCADQNLKGCTWRCRMASQPESGEQIRFNSGPEQNGRRDLVAVSGADRDTFAANGTAAAQHGCTRLRLHARAKAVSLGATLAVGLKCALGHRNALLILNENLSQCGKIQVYRRLSQESSARHVSKSRGRQNGHPLATLPDYERRGASW